VSTFNEIFQWILGIFAILYLIVRPLAVPISAIFTKKKNESVKVFIEGVSMLVPCHNEEEHLEEAVLSLLKQNIRKQIILIENGSSDRTGEIAFKLSEKYEEVTYTHVNVPKGKFPISIAMNHGLKFAKYPYMVRLDADTQLGDPNTIRRAVEPIASGKAVATACNVRLSNVKDSIITRIQAIEYYLSMELDRRSQRLYNGILVASGAMQCLRVDLVKKSGGYTTHPWTSEDMDMTLKMHDYGKVEMVPDAISYTDAPDTWKVIVKQRYWWMILGVMCMIAHRKSIGRPVGHKGGLGLIALPLKVFTSFRALFGIAYRSYYWIMLADWTDPVSIAKTFGIIVAIHLGLEYFGLVVVAPVAREKQGIEQWWVVPFYSLVYQPVMAIVRLFAIVGSIKVLWQFGKKLDVHVPVNDSKIA